MVEGTSVFGEYCKRWNGVGWGKICRALLDRSSIVIVVRIDGMHRLQVVDTIIDKVSVVW